MAGHWKVAMSSHELLIKAQFELYSFKNKASLRMLSICFVIISLSLSFCSILYHCLNGHVKWMIIMLLFMLVVSYSCFSIHKEFGLRGMHSVSFSWRLFSYEMFWLLFSWEPYLFCSFLFLHFPACAWKNWCSWFTVDCSSSNTFSWEPGESYYSQYVCLKLKHHNFLKKVFLI